MSTKGSAAQRRSRSCPYAEDVKTGTLYVKMAVVMTPLVAMIDGLPFAFFGKGKTPYLSVEQAIEWHENELRVTKGKGGNQKILDVLRKVQSEFKAGKEVAFLPDAANRCRPPGNTATTAPSDSA